MTARASRRLRIAVDNENPRRWMRIWSIRRSIRFYPTRYLGAKSGIAAVPAHTIQRQMEQFKKHNINKYLRGETSITIACYLCNTLRKRGGVAGVRSGSFVACAEVLGNCDVATEGGIPRSSRLGGSLKSLAFMRVCPKARSD